MRRSRGFLLALVLAGAAVPFVFAQQTAILSQDALAKITPTNFYFEGQLGPTQMRNAAGIQFARNRHLVAALVDTSGYASNIREKYEGFLISDEPFAIGGTQLTSGAYGFGFAESLKMNIYDVGGKLLHSVAVARDDKIPSPRPLAIVQSGDELRLYRGRNFAVLSVR